MVQESVVQSNMVQTLVNLQTTFESSSGSDMFNWLNNIFGF